jgi:hypothetical protein
MSSHHPLLSLAVAAAILGLAGCQATDTNRPTVWPISGSGSVQQDRRDSGNPTDIVLVRGEAPSAWRVTPIATVDSIATREDLPSELAAQEADLRRKAGRLGATAVIQIRSEALRTRGWERDPNTPFPAWRLGDGRSRFLRGLAVRHVGPPVASTSITIPSPPPEPSEPRPEGIQVEASGFIGGLSGLGQ